MSSLVFDPFDLISDVSSFSLNDDDIVLLQRTVELDNGDVLASGVRRLIDADGCVQVSESLNDAIECDELLASFGTFVDDVEPVLLLSVTRVERRAVIQARLRAASQRSLPKTVSLRSGSQATDVVELDTRSLHLNGMHGRLER